MARQAVPPDGIAVADDGSGPETKAVVEAFAAAHPELDVRHVWHEDAGFRKNAILNRAIATSEAEFLVFIDGDVLVRPDFVARHLELARPDRWSSGSLIRLDAAATAAVTEALVASGRVFERDWLKANRAIDRFGTWLKTRPLPEPVLAALDRVTPVQKAWGGANSSAFRAAILKVNGFDESMKYGGEDKELGVRLTNSGVRGQHLRYTASVVHLDHPRGYADPATIRANKARVRQARRSGKTWTPDGIVKGETRRGRRDPRREGRPLRRDRRGAYRGGAGLGGVGPARRTRGSGSRSSPTRPSPGRSSTASTPVAAPHIRAKVDYLPETPFAETLYLDTDTRVLGDLGDLFRLLERFELALAQRAHVPASPAPAVWRHAVPSSFPQAQQRGPALPLVAGGARASWRRGGRPMPRPGSRSTRSRCASCSG